MELEKVQEKWPIFGIMWRNNMWPQKRSFQKNFTKSMHVFLNFLRNYRHLLRKANRSRACKHQVCCWRERNQSPEEEADKTEPVTIATNHEDIEEANPTSTPPKDSTEVVPPMLIKIMTTIDRKLNCVINEITKSNDEDEVTPTNPLKRK